MFKKLFVIIALLVAVLAAAAPASADAALPNQRTDLKVLLLSATGNEPTTGAWETTFRREGVPFDEKVVGLGHSPLTAGSFADTLSGGVPHAKYDAVVIATGGLVIQNDQGQYVSALSNDEWTALRSFEARYGIREVTAFAYPTPEFGLNYPTASGDLSGVVGSLTSAGQLAFPYLNGPVPIDQGAYGYQATPIDPASFKTLVTGPGGSSLLGVLTNPDGRQQMVSTVDSNQYQLHSMLTRHGMLSWATRGVFLGYERNYMTVHVDDVFLSSDHWEPATHSETELNPIRMTAKDVTRAKDWSIRNGFRLDLLINASGSDVRGDQLTKELLRQKAYFGWVNHTYSGEPNDDTDYQHIVDDINQTIAWAQDNKVALDPTELVFDQHSGYNNPNTFPALQATGVKWIGDDASRFPVQRPWGPALSIPRHPSSIFYNVGTKAQMLDEYNYRYLPPSLGGNCENTSTTTCFTQPRTWEQLLDSETKIMMSHVLGNDPGPHYVHQANLAQDGVLMLVMDELLKRYRSYYKPALVQPTLKDDGLLMQKQAQWAAGNGQVTGYVQGGKLTLQSNASSTLPVPITGAAGVGSLYGGSTSGFVTLAAGGSLQYSLQSGVGF